MYIGAVSAYGELSYHSLPYPTVLLESSSLLWDRQTHPRCPVCHDKPLKDHEFCLRCDRWGLDGMTEKMIKFNIEYFYEKPTPIYFKLRIPHGCISN